MAQVFLDNRLVVQFDLPYRNERNYVHSADIFQALSSLAGEHFGPDAYVSSLVLRTQSTRQVRANFGTEANAFGKFSVASGSADVHGWLVESDVKVLRRVAYDETKLREAVLEEAPSARFATPLHGYTAFEHMLALMKVTGSLGKRDAWLCQANLRLPLLDSMPIAVTFQGVLCGFHAFGIAQNGKVIGSACAKIR